MVYKSTNTNKMSNHLSLNTKMIITYDNQGFGLDTKMWQGLTWSIQDVVVYKIHFYWIQRYKLTDFNPSIEFFQNQLKSFFILNISDNEIQNISATLYRLQEKFKDTKGVIRYVYRRTDNTMANRKSTIGKTMIYKTPYRNLQIE